MICKTQNQNNLRKNSWLIVSGDFSPSWGKGMADSVRQSHAHDVKQEADDWMRNMDRMAINFKNLPPVSNPGPSVRPCSLMVL